VPLPEGVPVAGEPWALDEVDVLIELAGGVDEPYRWATTALSRGMPYVTANKALLATHGRELAEVAATRGGALLASAAVGGGTPMLEVIAHLAATDRVRRLRGLLNATTTFILSAMGEGRSYADALAEAQAAGYAEADPSFDVEGRDAAQKLAILAWVAWGSWRPESAVSVQGIESRPVASGSIVRLVAEATPDVLRVAPLELDPSDPLATASGVECVLEVESRDAGTVTIRGPGAGGSATSGAVYADLARLVRGERPIIGQSAARKPIHA
jgi:homoserine dehydrogenase